MRDGCVCLLFPALYVEVREEGRKDSVREEGVMAKKLPVHYQGLRWERGYSGVQQSPHHSCGLSACMNTRQGHTDIT